jgi:hypothetical protein
MFPFGMSRSVLERGFRNNPAIRVLVCIKVCFGCLRTKDDRLKLEGQDGQ